MMKMHKTISAVHGCLESSLAVTLAADLRVYYQTSQAVPELQPTTSSSKEAQEGPARLRSRKPVESSRILKGVDGRTILSKWLKWFRLSTSFGECTRFSLQDAA